MTKNKRLRRGPLAPVMASTAAESGMCSNVGVNVAWVAPVGEISPSPRPGDPLITLVGVLGAPSKPRLSTDEVDGGQVDAVDIGANGVTTAASGRGN